MKTKPNQPHTLNIPSQIYQYMAKSCHRLWFLPSSRSYNLTISHEHKFVWFRIAKVGTRSIYFHLKSQNIQLDCEHPFDIHYPYNKYRNYFKFAFVRNPWDRLISCWQNKVLTENHWGFSKESLKEMRHLPNFIEYVSDLDLTTCNNHLRLQCCLIDLNNVDYIGHFENFRHDYEVVCQKIGISTENLEHRNKSVHRDYRSYYDDRMVEKIYTLYQKRYTDFWL